MKLKWRCFLACLTQVIILSCKPSASPQALVSPELNKTIPAGTIQQLNCTQKPGFSYLVYVPHSIQPGTPSPLIIWFDPHHSAITPLEKYAALAEKHQCIMMASENSENGLSAAAYADIGKALLEDISQRMPIDSQSIVAGGFSGGARVSLLLAGIIPQIQHIIMMGAGGHQFPPHLKSIYFLGGTSDFNLNEIYSSMKKIYQTSSSGMVLFDGKHDWAPEEEMNRALHFSLRATATEIQSERQAFKKLIPAWDAAFEKENMLQQQYLSKFQVHQDSNFWKTEIGLLKNDPQFQSGSGKSMQGRLLGFLSIYVWSACNQMLKQRQQEALELYTNLYRTIDRENPEWAFMKAIHAARERNAESCKTYLSLAKSMGFKETDRIRKDPDISSLLRPAELNIY